MNSISSHSPAFFRVVIAPIIFLLSSTIGVKAQLVPDGGTLAINGFNTNVAGTVTIGSTGNNTTLIVTNSGTVTNFGFGNISLNAGAKTNRVTVTGANSTWWMPQNLNLGQAGAFSRLIVTNGGLVENYAGRIGRLYDGTNNVAIVTGPGSKWINHNDLTVGEDGSFNQVIVTNGGSVFTANTLIGLNAGSSNNNLTLAGGTLITTNVVGTAITDIRRGTLVMNSGTLETDQIFLTNGLAGQVTFNGGTIITRGGTISNVGGTVMGISGGGAGAPAVLDLRAGQPLSLFNAFILGQSSSDNRLYITNGGTFSDLSTAPAVIAQNALSSGNSVVVSGGSSLWTNSFDLTIGYSGFSNSMHISAGGVVVNRIGTVGNFSTANSNLVVVSGTGSLWKNRDNLVVGWASYGNTLIVTNGGTVTNTGHGQIGLNSPSCTNTVIVTGSNSVWGTAQTLFLGASGYLNQLLVTNGGFVQSLYGFIGSAGGVSNTATITGTNSVWRMGNDLHVGAVGSQNQVLVTQGGKLQCDYGMIGANLINTGTGSSNSVVISGPGSQWPLNRLFIGDLGSANRLIVTNGGTVTVVSNVLGILPTSRSNTVLVTGANSLLANSQHFYVGYDGSYSQFTVSNSAVVKADPFVLGLNPASSNNAATVGSLGSLITTNIFATGKTDVRRGVLAVNSGLLLTDFLLLTNASGQIAFNSGVVQTKSTTQNNGSTFFIGDTVSAAMLELLDTGTHTFANGLQINNNGVLKGNGTIIGDVTNGSGGTLAPGTSIGRLTITGSLTLAPGSLNIFELDKGSSTNDNIIGLTSLTMDGSLQVNNLSGTLALGDSFKLFNSASYLGAFSSVSLPLLGPGLAWTNKLALNGTIEVIAGRDFGVDVSHFQGAAGVSQSSWDQMYSDNKHFAFIKATEGLTGPDDAAMTNNVARALAAGLFVGVYHYAHPENRTNATGAVQEADHFLGYAGSAIGPGRLRPVLDLEGSASSLTTTGLTVWAMAFSDRIKALRGNGAAPILYMNRSFANSEVDSRLAGYDLWLAYYTNVDVSVVSPPPTISFPNPTGVFTNWAFWQHSNTGSSGGISPLDLDVCHSEYKSLQSFIIPTPAPIFTLNSISLGGGVFQFSFTNVPGTHFTILATTNLTIPLSNWTQLTNVNEISAGVFQFTDTQTTNSPGRFYRVRSP